MAKKDQILLQELLDIVTTGRAADPRGHWKDNLDAGLHAWRKGRPGSMNRPRLTNAIRARAVPREAALWWQKLLSNEERGVRDDGRIFYYNGYEPLSGIYWGWSLVGEATAFHLLRGIQGPVFREACELLRRSIRRHLGMATLCAVGDLVIRGPQGRVSYRGPAVLSPGARTKGDVSANNRNINAVFAHAVAMPPQIDRKDRLTELALALPPDTWGLSPEDRRQIRTFLQPGEPSKETARYIVDNLLPNTFTVASFELRRYSDRMIGVMHTNPNGTSGATYFSEVPTGPAAESTDVRFLYPYGGAVRVRTKNLIGSGNCRLDIRGDRKFYVCENMREDEVEKKRREGRRPVRFQEEAEIPQEPPRLVFQVDANKALHLI